MDIATSLGLLCGVGVVGLVIMMGGDLHMFVSEHAFIVIFGGSFAATLIRFPLSSIFHGLPLGAKFAFTMRRSTQRELVDELAGLAEVARKSGPMGLEKVATEDPFLTKGIRFVADGYDTNFIRDNLERDRDNFLSHLDEGQKIYRAVGDCAPAFGMIGTLIGMVQMFANMTDPSKLGPFMAGALLATFYGAALANMFCLPIADKLHLKLVDEEINRTLIIDGILMIREAKSPTLVRELCRPDGPAGIFLRDAGRLFHPGPGQAASRCRLDARRLRRAGQGALFRHYRSARLADAAAAQERRADRSERCLGQSHAGRQRHQAHAGRKIPGRPEIRARLRLVASGVAADAGH